ncbi:right-handed parallel beta-helix repeat-containing protein [Methylobacterium sp. P31]
MARWTNSAAAMVLMGMIYSASWAFGTGRTGADRPDPAGCGACNVQAPVADPGIACSAPSLAAGQDACGGVRDAAIAAAGHVPVVDPQSAFFVSPQGDDANTGTLDAPFATLGRAQLAMRDTRTKKTTYLRAGQYMPTAVANCDGEGGTCALNLGPKDSGETWSYYPPDGYNSAEISGGSTRPGEGLKWIIYVEGRDISINGLTLHHFRYAGLGSTGGVDHLTIVNNHIHHGFERAPGNPGAFSCYGCSNTTVSRNVIHDVPTFGVSLANVNGDISNLLIERNLVFDTCLAVTDCGAIYLLDTEASASNIRIQDNYIRDGNASAAVRTGGGGGSAIYADDCTSNIRISGNVIAGRNGSNTIHLHGGSNIQIVGNLTDLSRYGGAAAVFQTSSGPGCTDAGPMSGNAYTGNIIIGAGGGGGFWLLSGSPQNTPFIRSNVFFDYGGRGLNTGGTYQDPSPRVLDPRLSGWSYVLLETSPLLNGPAAFTPLRGHWGPPGYALPRSGTPPSSPH